MKPKAGRRRGGTGGLTTADLVVLSLLAEEPMHGYDLLGAYGRQEVEDWASVSKAQVYYALKKLEAARLLRAEAVPGDARGRTAYSVTDAGADALRAGLADPSWAGSRIPQPFTTWVGLSIHADPHDRAEMVRRRIDFLGREIERERESLRVIETLGTERARRGASIVRLVVAQLTAELDWLQAEFGGGRPAGG